MTCQITFPSVDVAPIGGALIPTALIVRGIVTCANASATTVTVSTSVTGPAVALTPGPAGDFLATLPITSGIACGDKVQVSMVGHCSDGSTCTYSDEAYIDCGLCARARLSVTQAPCVAGLQPITLNADIAIPAGATYQFQWQSGAGAVSAVFAVINVAGTASTLHAAPASTFSYVPGSYTARLVQISPPASECAPLQISFAAQCVACPTVSGSVVVGACDASGHRPVTYTLTFMPQIAMGATASAVIAYGGPNTSGLIVASVPINTSTSAASSASHTTTLPPSSAPYYSTATVNVTAQGQTCPAAVVAFDSAPGGVPPGVIVDTCSVCPSNIDVTVLPPATGWCVPASGAAAGAATLVADVVWPPAATFKPVPSRYDWTITLPNGVTAKQSNVMPTAGSSCTVTTAAGWTGSGSLNNAVDLRQVSTYSVSAVAKFPPSASLPANPDGTPACNLSGANSFALSACNVTVQPPCPSIRLMATSADCADPAAGKAATIGFVAGITDPAHLATAIEWNFGDPASGASNLLTSPAGMLTASHSYATAGNYAVTARVLNSGACNATGGSDTASLALIVTTCPCPPGTARNAAGVCAPVIPPPCPAGQTRNAAGVCVPTATTPSCTIWCILVGIFFVAVPISAHISTTAHCLLPVWGAAIHAAILVAVIAFFVALCGACCLWPFLVLGSILGVVATVVYAIWGGFPACWWLGLILLVGYVLSAIGFWLTCRSSMPPGP